MIERVSNEVDAEICDNLLTKLIQDERENYDPYLSESLVIKDYFKYVITDDKKIVLVYKENDIIVGYLYLKNMTNYSYLIDGLYVEKEYRNKGIASALLKYSLDLLNDMNVKVIDINVKKENVGAYKLYKKFGFEVDTYTMKFYNK